MAHFTGPGLNTGVGVYRQLITQEAASGGTNAQAAAQGQLTDSFLNNFAVTDSFCPLTSQGVQSLEQLAKNQGNGTTVNHNIFNAFKNQLLDNGGANGKIAGVSVSNILKNGFGIQQDSTYQNPFDTQFD